MLKRTITCMASAALAAAELACAESYPAKPIRIVTTEVGGSGDFTARLIAQGISPVLGQPIIAENRGGGGAISGEIVARAAPDGYTLLLPGSTLWITPMLRGLVTYNALTDFAPITLIAVQPNVIVVHSALAASSVQDLIALAKAKPGVLNYASGPTGSSPHLAAELFKSMAGVDIVGVSYKGAALALNDLIAGRMQVMFPNAAAVNSHLKSGRLKVLAIATAGPSNLFPGLPTVSDSGLPGYVSGNISGIFAPAKTPAAVIGRLNEEIVHFLSSPDVKEKFFSSGTEILAEPAEQLTASMRADIARMSKVINDAHIRSQ
jgi:tripartite-type tricarboxylate transporter receptor subunit TctC